jgi:type II secretion system protein G
MMTSLKKRQGGFTIVELLIVIIIIGILATLVVVQFTNQQKKARDAQRKTDIGALETNLEAYYAENGKYPVLADLNSTTLKGLKAETLKDPKATSDAPRSGAASATQYGYTVTPANCDNTTTDCTNFEVSAVLEDGNTPYTKKSEN